MTNQKTANITVQKSWSEIILQQGKSINPSQKVEQSDGFDAQLKYKNIKILVISNSSSTQPSQHIQLKMLTEDQLRIVSSLLILVPLSFFIRFIRPTQYRYVYSLLLSCLLQVYVFQADMIWLHIQSIIVFFLIRMFKGKNIGAIVTIQSILFLSSYHINGIIYNYGGWVMDASALLMIQVCKYSLLAYAIQDGSCSQQKLTQQQKKYKITNQISFYEYIGFVNFLPTSVIGPPIEFKEYKSFMELQNPYDNIPQTISETFKVLGHSLLCAFIFSAGQFIAPIAYMKTDQFYQKNSFYILFYTFASITFMRFKYYFGWKLSLASIHSSGVSYNGENFHLINTCSPIIIQADKHIRSKISHWNTAVQEWLRKAVYQRSPFKSRGVSQLYVFMISAFWHGFYPGYYFSFFLWFVQVYTQGQIFKYSKHQSSRLKQFYRKFGLFGKFLVTFIVNLVFSHNATFFVLLDYGLCIRLLEKVNYIPQTILLTLAVTFTWLNMMRSKKVKKGKNPQITPAMINKEDAGQKTYKKQ